MRTWIMTASIIFQLFLTSYSKADSWASPKPSHSISANSKYIVATFPLDYANTNIPSHIEVYQVIDAAIVAHYSRTEEYSYDFTDSTVMSTLERLLKSHVLNNKLLLLWKTDLSNDIAPVDTLIGNNGKCVVTLDEWGGVGYGDDVVAFYNKDGQIKNYSLETILRENGIHGTDDIPHSISSRWWRSNCIELFFEYQTTSYFCIWLEWKNQWLIWETDTGKIIKLNDEFECALDRHIEKYVLQIINTWKSHDEEVVNACKLIGRRGTVESHNLLRQLLTDTSFQTHGLWFQEDSLWLDILEWFNISTTRSSRLEHYYSCSEIRRAADEALSKLDKTISPNATLNDEDRYYYLGTIEGNVTLSRTPGRKGGLWIYLIPESTAKADWYKKEALHYLHANFDHYLYATVKKTVPFKLYGVTPGKYWIKVVWDKEEPFAKYDDVICIPQQADKESTKKEIFEIKAGEITDVGVLDCKD